MCCFPCFLIYAVRPVTCLSSAGRVCGSASAAAVGNVLRCVVIVSSGYTSELFLAACCIRRRMPHVRRRRSVGTCLVLCHHMYAQGARIAFAAVQHVEVVWLVTKAKACAEPQTLDNRLDSCCTECHHFRDMLLSRPVIHINPGVGNCLAHTGCAW